MAPNDRRTDTRGMPGGKFAYLAVGAFVLVIVFAIVWGLGETADIDATPHGQGGTSSLLDREAEESFPAPSPEAASPDPVNADQPVRTN